MNDERLLARIDGLIEKAVQGGIGDYDGNDINSWHADGHAVMKVVYGPGVEEQSFGLISFWPIRNTLAPPHDRPTSQDFAAAEKKGVDSALSQLRTARGVIELRQPEPDEDAKVPADYARSLDLIERITEHIKDSNDNRPAHIEDWKERARLYLRLVYGEPSGMIARFDQIRWIRGSVAQTHLEVGMFKAPPAPPKKAGVPEAVAMLKATIEELELNPQLGSRTTASEGMTVDLHPWLEDQRAKLEHGYVHDAVRGAATAIENRLREKMGSKQGKPGDLVGQGFSLQSVERPTKRLRFLDIDVDDPDYKSAHEGAMHFGRGCFLAIRNISTHADEVDPDEALDALHALNLLARWIDRSVVSESA